MRFIAGKGEPSLLQVSAGIDIRVIAQGKITALNWHPRQSVIMFLIRKIKGKKLRLRLFAHAVEYHARTFGKAAAESVNLL